MFRTPPVFLPRYELKGILTLTTPMHVGDGASSKVRIPRREENTPEGKVLTPIEVNTICVDQRKCAMIPGSTLKGVLRAWLEQRALTGPEFDAVFGSTLNGQPKAGGKVEFWDATLSQIPDLAGRMRRHWDPVRGTGVEARAAIDARTRTAGDAKLYQLEYVPEGSSFEVTVRTRGLTLEELLFLARALDAFGQGVRIGAEGTNGWGAVTWKRTSVRWTPEAAVRAWLANPDAAGYWRDCPTDLAHSGNHYPGTEPPARARISLKLHFAGSVLVNDPTQARKKEEAGGPISFASVRRQDDQFYLPGSSVRGAMRSQAARIWRTIAQDHTPGEGAGLLPEAKRSGDERRLHPFARLFGAPGWRAPIEIEDFRLIEGGSLRTQEFVAIDRFTGGASDSAKFTAKALDRPVFEGELSIDLRRLTAVCGGHDRWPWLLLAFLLRDLAEGDVAFGFGAGKGYGRVGRAAATFTDLPPQGQTILAGYPFGAPATDPAIVQAAYEELMAEIEKVALPEYVEVRRRGA